MKKRLLFQCIIIAIFLWTADSAFSQSFNWVRQIGTAGSSSGYSLKADNIGNIYVTGSFQVAALFDGVSRTSKGGSDIFIAKYSDSGKLIWVRTSGGTGYDEGSSLRLDPKGKSFVATGFMQDCQFEDTTLLGSPFFVAKYDTSGGLLWVKGITSSGGGSETSAAIDSSGNIFITGGSYGYAVFDTLMAKSPFFIAKYDQAGVVRWVKGLEYPTKYMAIQPSDINCDLLNNVYVTGYVYADTIRFDSTHYLIPQGGGNLLLVKYDSEGNIAWAKKSDNVEFAVSNAMSFDTDNNIYLTGNFKNKIKFDSIALEGNNTGTAFVAKYDTSGNAKWATKVEGAGFSNGRGITVDRNGNIYVTGVASDASKLDTIELTHGGIFVAKYDISGKCVFATTAGSNPANLWSMARDIAVTDSNEIYVTGYLNGTVHFGQILVTNTGGVSIFITKLSNNPPTGVEQTSSNLTTYVLNQNYPNPFNPLTTISFKISYPAFVSLKVYNILGEEIATLASENISAGLHTRIWDATNVASGVYFYRLRSGGYSESKKLILQK